MPWRLMGFIVVIALVTAFIGFNLGNSCDLSLGFVILSGVPIFLTVFVSFGVGMLAALPFVFVRRGKMRKKDNEKKDEFVSLPTYQQALPEKTKAKGRAKKGDSDLVDGSYGID